MRRKISVILQGMSDRNARMMDIAHGEKQGEKF